MQSIYVISLTTANTIRMLQRVATVFSRQRINIEQLSVYETAYKGVSHFSIIIHADSVLVQKLVRQLQKIIELIDVKINSHVIDLPQAHYATAM